LEIVTWEYVLLEHDSIMNSEGLRSFPGNDMIEVLLFSFIEHHMQPEGESRIATACGLA